MVLRIGVPSLGAELRSPTCCQPIQSSWASRPSSERRPSDYLRPHVFSRQQRCSRVAARTAEQSALNEQASISYGAQEVAEDQVSVLERSLQLRTAAPGTSKRVVAAGELLQSTWEHRLITGGSIMLMLALLGKGVSEIGSPAEAAGGAAAFLFAYALSDFLTGIYHWSVDNYGDGSTPIVGDQIAAFQGHHQRPWTITEREFCNNVHKVFKPAAPFTALCLLASPWTPGWLDIGLATATLLTCMSQQFHAWAHMKASELPSVVKGLQEAGLLVSRKEHGAHHKAPFGEKYCIVSGAWNLILDAGGNASFFRQLEQIVHAKTGVEPRCWHEPEYSWQEME